MASMPQSQTESTFDLMALAEWVVGLILAIIPAGIVVVIYFGGMPDSVGEYTLIVCGWLVLAVFIRDRGLAAKCMQHRTEDHFPTPASRGWGEL